MFIAFEGPDNVGKSTSAAALSADPPIYNATKERHAGEQVDILTDPGIVVCYDRIDWFSHMVYRLALPDREWNDPRVRTVFAMPDTHLVVKLHRPDLADFTADEVVDTPIAIVNATYFYFADFFTRLNEQRDFALFKTISMIEVENTPEGYSQRLASFSSPITDPTPFGRHTITDDELLALLQAEDAQRL